MKRGVIVGKVRGMGGGFFCATRPFQRGRPTPLSSDLLFHLLQRTWGGVIGMEDYHLSDGTELSIPSGAYYATGLGYELENHGVAPDIEASRCPMSSKGALCPASCVRRCFVLESHAWIPPSPRATAQVDFGPLDYLQGRDPQLERAIAIIQAELLKRPPSPNFDDTPRYTKPPQRRQGGGAVAP